MLKRIGVLFFVLGILAANVTFAQRSRGGSVNVRGYTGKDGTDVPPHYRSKPDGNFSNNWSTKGNLNPYTGKEGTLVIPPLGHSFSWAWVTPSGEVRPYGNLRSPSYHLPWYEYKEEIWPSAGAEEKSAYLTHYNQRVIKPLPPDKPPSPPIINIPAFTESPDTLFFADPDEKEITVHIIPGTNYHRAGCQLLNRGGIPIKLREAIAQGYSPCKMCRP